MKPSIENIEKVKKVFAEFIASIEQDNLDFETEHCSSLEDGVVTKSFKVNYSFKSI